jgi:hypothetical protein
MGCVAVWQSIFGIDPTIVRVIAVLLVFADGLGILAYIVMAIVIPLEDSKVATPKETAKIQADVDLSVLNMDEGHFPKEGGYYVSDNFDTAQNRVYLVIDCDVSRVEVKGDKALSKPQPI